MLDRLDKIVGSKFIIAIMLSLATVFIYIFKVQPDVATAASTLITYFAVLAFVVWRQTEMSAREDITNENPDQLKIIILYKYSENNLTFLSDLINKYSGRNLQFVHIKTDESQVRDLESELNNCDGLYCIWNTDLSSNIEAYIKVIENWLARYESKPFIIIKEKKETDDVLQGISNTYKVINEDIALESLAILLSRAMSRTSRFIRNLRTWKMAFWTTTFFLLTMLSGVIFLHLSKNEMPYNELKDLFPLSSISQLNYQLEKDTTSISEITKNQARKIINQVAEGKCSELRRFFNVNDIDISIWRNFDDPNSLKRITETTGKTDTLPLNQSVAACACINNVIAARIPPDDKFMYWDIDTGKEKDKEKLNKSKSNICEFFPTNKDKDKYIICLPTELDKGSYNLVSLSSANPIIIKDDKVKKILLEIALMSSIIPNKLLEK